MPIENDEMKKKHKTKQQLRHCENNQRNDGKAFAIDLEITILIDLYPFSSKWIIYKIVSMRIKSALNAYVLASVCGFILMC